LSSIVFAAVIAALYFVIARGLWLLRNWARIVVIVLQVLSVLGILSQLSNNSSGLVLIVAVFGLAIAAYILDFINVYFDFQHTFCVSIAFGSCVARNTFP
jgi:hypothetical protein